MVRRVEQEVRKAEQEVRRGEQEVRRGEQEVRRSLSMRGEKNMKENKEDFSITQVVTRNIVTDSFQSIRNIFGLRLRGYEKMINNTTQLLIDRMNAQYNEVEWWRLSINPLGKQSVMVSIYGRGVKNE